MVEKVVIIGASAKRERYSNMAQRLLMEIGCAVIPVNPGHSDIEGVPTIRHLSAVQEPVDTVTMYVNPEISEKLKDELIRLKPRRVIFNPGTESQSLAKTLRERDIMVIEGCTLVLIRTGQW
jgi:predicted CoA-binding protein